MDQGEEPSEPGDAARRRRLNDQLELVAPVEGGDALPVAPHEFGKTDADRIGSAAPPTQRAMILITPQFYRTAR